MTKSKVFLGLTAFTLAIAGALSTKATNRFNTYTGFTKASATGTCHKQSVAVACTTTSQTNVCKTANGVRTIYTSISCVNKLFKLAQ